MILDGKKVRDEILEKAKIKIKANDWDIILAIITVGDDQASKIYVKNKEKYCNYVGIQVIKYQLPENVTEKELVSLIDTLNKDPKITGIILQSPISHHLNFDKCSGFIAPKKDVDGFTKDNIYNLYLGQKTILPCTVKGIIKLLEYYKIPIAGANAVIVGRGNIVGHPLSLALLNKNATVTVLHSKSQNIKDITKNADILISATGIANLISADMVKENAVVVDVGVDYVDGKIVGDVKYDEVKDIASYITPNPGGVGPMTVAMIIDNLISLKEYNNG